MEHLHVMGAKKQTVWLKLQYKEWYSCQQKYLKQTHKCHTYRLTYMYTKGLHTYKLIYNYSQQLLHNQRLTLTRKLLTSKLTN